MPRKGDKEDYNPRWDLGVVPDGWPRAVGAVRGAGKCLQRCRACSELHPEGETPRKCLNVIGMMAEQGIDLSRKESKDAKRNSRDG